MEFKRNQLICAAMMLLHSFRDIVQHCGILHFINSQALLPLLLFPVRGLLKKQVACHHGDDVSDYGMTI